MKEYNPKMHYKSKHDYFFASFPEGQSVSVNGILSYLEQLIKKVFCVAHKLPVIFLFVPLSVE